MILDTIKTLIHEQMGIDTDLITMNTNISEDLEADSLDKVEMIMTAEEEFDVVIDDEAAMAFVTIGDVVNYLEKLIENK
ncbi:MAG: acyl carrier protein [Clostridia bacterium]